MNINFQDIKVRMIRTKDLLMAVGIVPIVASILLMIVASVITAIFSGIISVSSLFRFSSANFIWYVPSYLVSGCITAFIMIAFMGSISYARRTRQKVTFAQFFKIGVELTKKYYLSMIIWLIVPMVIMGAITSQVTISLAYDFYFKSYLYSLLISLVSAIFIGVKCFCIVRFANAQKFVSINSTENQFLYIVSLGIALLYAVVAFIPVVGSMVQGILSIVVSFLFIPFILVSDDGNCEDITSLIDCNVNNTTNNNSAMNYNNNNMYNSNINSNNNSYNGNINDISNNTSNSNNTYSYGNNNSYSYGNNNSEVNNFCTKCGRKQQPDSRFCSGCGNPL